MTMPGIKAKRKQFVRKTLMRTKAQSERTAEQRQESPEEYAQTEVQQGIFDVAARTGNTAKSTARMSYRKFRAMQEKRKNLTLQGSAQSASKLTEKEKVTVPTQTERREMFKKQRFRQKAMQMMTRLRRFADVGSRISTCFLRIGVHAERFTPQNKRKEAFSMICPLYSFQCFISLFAI